MLLPNIGAKSKSALLGGTKPLSASRKKVCMDDSFKNKRFTSLGSGTPGITYSLSRGPAKWANSVHLLLDKT
jgi:hypothetical protein